MMSIKKLYSFVFLFCFFVSIVVPIFPKTTGGMMYHVLGTSLIPVLLLPWVLNLRYPFFFHFSFSFIILFIMTAGALIHEENVDIASLASAFKIIYFGLYILMGYAFTSNSSYSPNEFTKVYMWLLVFSIFFGVVELIFPSISYYLYKRESMEILEDKLSSIFNTTYHLAFFLLFGFLYYLNLLLSILKKSMKRNFILPLIKLSVIFCFILLTQSRMFVMVAIFITVFLFASVILKRINKFNVLLPVAIIIASILMLGFYFWEQFSERFYYIIYGIDFLISGKLDFSGDGVGSFNTRINQILFSLEQISNNPFIGVGSGKDLYLESLYAYLLYKYAFPGLIFYFVMLYFLIKRIKIIMNGYLNEDTRLFFQTCYWFFLLSPVYFLSGPLFEVPKLSLYFFVIIGVIYGYQKMEEPNEK